MQEVLDSVAVGSVEVILVEMTLQEVDSLQVKVHLPVVKAFSLEGPQLHHSSNNRQIPMVRNLT